MSSGFAYRLPTKFCNRHNAGADLVTPRLGGPDTPGAQRAEHGTVVHCILVVDF